jgi:hypothetical protein
MGFSVNLQGIKGIEDALKRIDTSLKKDVSNEIAASALKIQSDAKRLAQLRNGIKFDKLSELTFAIESTASYSPYVEFGTGGKVSVPSDFQAYAKTFKGGKAGKFKDMVDALTLWVRKKGIGNGRNDKGMAFVIARSILQKGLRPQPFLIPAYEQEKPKLIQRLKKLLNA